MIEFEPKNETGKRVLFTPGPLTTTRSVREAMLLDIGSWDRDCVDVVADIRRGLLALAGDRADLTCTLLQGSGTYGVESVIGAAVPPGGKLLVLANGAYGERAALIAQTLGVPHSVHRDPENRPHSPEAVARALQADASISHVVCVHCETTTGVIHPLREIGLVVASAGRRFIVDAISTFGAYAIGTGEATDFDAGPIDHLVGSANKCIEGTPGFSFVLSRRDAMAETNGNARSLSLDLYGQWAYMEKTGQFRYTPPTHVLLAFRRALEELRAEGGIPARSARYRENHRVLTEGMAELGFEPFVAPGDQSHIITAFHYPSPSFDFPAFYDRLHECGYIIYPGKLTDVPTFRIGNIGSIDANEIRALLGAIRDVHASMKT